MATNTNTAKWCTPIGIATTTATTGTSTPTVRICITGTRTERTNT